jgi:hypothetical protein
MKNMIEKRCKGIKHKVIEVGDMMMERNLG